ncbi:MAG: hypothetical protein WCI73_00945 [Phycisphaerae bacterium]
MIVELAASALITYGMPSRGTSETAQFVASQAEKGQRRLQDSFSLGWGARQAFAELDALAVECNAANWDGYGAAAVSANALALARQFITALPIGTPAPSIGAEPDGHVTLEWYRSPQRTLSVSVSAEGELHYAALLGQRTAYGTELYFGMVPQILLVLINSVNPTSRTVAA